MGYTKHMYENDIHGIKQNFSSYIKSISKILSKDYDFESIISLLKEYYPYEWQILNEKYQYYCKQDKTLLSRGKKIRYSMNCPENIIKHLKITKNLLSDEYKKNYIKNFDENKRLKYEYELKEIRTPKIQKIQKKVEKAKLKTQQMEPFFLDALMGLYDRKNTTQEDKVYIMNELQKYYCPKVINFFKKQLHSEYNMQLRQMALFHLQSLGHYAVLRKQKYMKIHTKNKKRKEFLKKVYPYQKFNIQFLPEELEYRISNNSKEQRLKVYDFFISHSSSDFQEVQNIIDELNTKNKNVYCDWIHDHDYLKRHLVGPATKSVIEKRLEQSNQLLFVESDNSLNSDWVKYELNYFLELGKPIFVIKKEDIQSENYKYTLLNDKWFINENYKAIDLFNLKIEYK